MQILETSILMRSLPAGKHGRRMKIKFASQASASVPTFVLFVNDPLLRNDNYDRFLIKRFREEIPSLLGSPLRLLYRKSAGTETKKKKH